MPTAVLTGFLHRGNMIPRGYSLGSVLFLLAPTRSVTGLRRLITLLMHFRGLLRSSTPLTRILPSVCGRRRRHCTNCALHRLYRRVRSLCTHRGIGRLRGRVFHGRRFPHMDVGPRRTGCTCLHNRIRLIHLPSTRNHVTTRNTLPCPPNILYIIPNRV